jgi:hypothetical protein
MLFRTIHIVRHREGNVMESIAINPAAILYVRPGAEPFPKDPTEVFMANDVHLSLNCGYEHVCMLLDNLTKEKP